METVALKEKPRREVVALGGTITLSEAAAVTGRSYNYMWRAYKRGLIAGTEIGGIIRVRVDQFQRVTV